MPNKTKPPKPPKYPKGSPVKSGRRSTVSGKKGSSEMPLILKIFNLLKR